MLFNNYSFIFFYLPVVWVLYVVVLARSQKVALYFLSISSFVFYSMWQIESLPLLVLSICFNYFCVRLFIVESVRRYIFIFGVLVNLAVLFYFKYSTFVISDILGVQYNSASWDGHYLPLGISFWTFTQLVYLIDSYNDRVYSNDIGTYSLFVNFFPHLVAGPLLHHRDILPQFENDLFSKITLQRVSAGLVVFLIGLAKKTLLADPIAVYVDQLYDVDRTFTFFVSWMASLAYTLQLYFDFSGYSDMAVGLALCFGLMLPWNFDSPLKATSIISFWQRWHMSLTRYVNQYAFNPIALFFQRNFVSRSRSVEFGVHVCVPLIIVFLILGLWHGASFTFILFGLLHGFYLVVNHTFRHCCRSVGCRFSIPAWLGWLVTFVSVVVGMVVFRSNTLEQAFEIWGGMLGLNGAVLPPLFESLIGSVASYEVNFLQLTEGDALSLLAYSVVGLLVILACPNTRILMDQMVSRLPVTVDRGYVRTFWAILGIICALGLLEVNKPTYFIYFNF